MRIKQRIKNVPLVRNALYGKRLYVKYSRLFHDQSRNKFVISRLRDIHVVGYDCERSKQLSSLIDNVSIHHSGEYSFFYSIDPYKCVIYKKPVFDNSTIDYSWVVDSSLKEQLELCPGASSSLNESCKLLFDALRRYCKRLDDYSISKSIVDEIESLFERPAVHFHESLQRVLFVNQWIWQTSHNDNGFGHLDWILNGVLTHDIESGHITEQQAKDYLKEFVLILHEYYWFKSAQLVGDTGQIIILGGIDSNGIYRFNKLTYLFIEVLKDLKLGDPKVLLRVSKGMPSDLLELAVDSIATGIGAPVLANDERIIPALLAFGYDENDSYDYITSACWEPLIVDSGDENNMKILNLCVPLLNLFENENVLELSSFEMVKELYFKYIELFIDEWINNLVSLQFEEDPLLTLFSPYAIKQGKDVVRGGAKYNNIGVTSVGLANAVNSLLNICQYVYDDSAYSLSDLNEFRRNNFSGQELLLQKLNNSQLSFGRDDERVVALSNEIIKCVSECLNKYHTALGGRFKFGLSSPAYIKAAELTPATFDGRKNGDPFSVHISGKNGIAPTELISFATSLDTESNCINGNVIDFIIPQRDMIDAKDKIVQLIKSSISMGFYEMQISVLDSLTLIDAQKHPEKYPNLIVRVWGFSACFTDLPKEYQDNIIKRAKEAEGI